MVNISELFDGSEAHLLEKCDTCGEVFNNSGCCKDCCCGGDFEDIMESSLDS